MTRFFLNTVFFIALLCFSPHLSHADQLFAGTQGVPTLFGIRGHVYQYLSDTTWRDLNPTKNIGQAVMQIVFFKDTLYAATQTRSGYGGCDSLDCGYGQVWKYLGMPNAWVQVGGNLDNSVMVLLIYNNTLYAGTSLVEKFPNGGNLYKLVAGNWILKGNGGSSGWRTGIVTNLFPPVAPIPQIYLGELNVDAFARYTDGSGLVPLQNLGGSCVWGFKEYQGALYSGHWHGPVYKTTNGTSWTLAHHTGEDHNWGMEVFQGRLYMGSGNGDGFSPGRLRSFDGTKWEVVHTWPAKVNAEGVTALATDTRQTRLYIGLGVPDGYYTGDGVAQVWQYDGINFARISRVDHFGGGIQSLVTHSTGCTTFEDLYQTISDAEIDNEGIRNSLLSKEKNSQRQYDLGNLHASGNILCALLHEVDAQDGKHIDPHSAEEIRDCVRSLAEALGIPLPCLERIEDVAVSIGSSPNPFRSSTTIHYQIPPTPFIKGGKGDFVFSKGGAEGGGFTPSSSPPKLGGDIEGVQHVQLSIYDISGRLVKTLMDELQEPGVYQLQITKNQFPGSGIYFYRLNTSMGFTQTRKLILIR